MFWLKAITIIIVYIIFLPLTIVTQCARVIKEDIIFIYKSLKEEHESR